jgi:hypothetical protein
MDKAVTLGHLARGRVDNVDTALDASVTLNEILRAKPVSHNEQRLFIAVVEEIQRDPQRPGTGDRP